MSVVNFFLCFLIMSENEENLDRANKIPAQAYGKFYVKEKEFL